MIEPTRIMDEFDNIRSGLTTERKVTVEERHSVKHTRFPVLSTPMMISLMELVCKDLVQGLLPPGFITVGYEVNVKHKTAVQLGTEINVWCKLLEADGRKLLFEVRVSAGDKIVGEGFHRRTIVPY
jgi:fluoroacetyl-CoA thioesterase